MAIRNVSIEDTHTPKFTAALFTIARTWKQLKSPSMEEWIKKLWHIYTHTHTHTYIYIHTYVYTHAYTIEYYSAIKRDGIVSFAEVWMDLATVAEWSQREKNKYITHIWGFPRGSSGKESACNVRHLGSIPGLGSSPGEGKGYPLQYTGLENSKECIVHGVAKSRTPLSDFHFHMWNLEK